MCGIRYVINTSVIEVKIVGDHWLIHFDGSRESLALAHKDEPKPFEEGDEVKITFEKVNNAKSS